MLTKSVTSVISVVLKHIAWAKKSVQSVRSVSNNIRMVSPYSSLCQNGKQVEIITKMIFELCYIEVINSYICPAFLTFLKFVIGHIARYAPSSKLRNQQKYRSKLANLFFHHYLVTEKFVHLHHKADASRRQVLHGSYKQQVVYDRTKSN